jgi:predicted Zn-dependent protease
MKRAAITLALVLAAAPASAQFGRLGEIERRATQVKKVADLDISDKEERQIGESASGRVRAEFGVMQDAALTRYVSLVGNVLAKASSRPDLQWEFIVLDTDGVNAFAAPGGLVHITRGALGLMKSEAELAGVLGHEIAHITKKHTVNAIRKSSAVKLGTEETGSRTSYFYTMLADAVYDNIVEKGFDRGDENDADQEGARLANKAGYNPTGLTAFLGRLIDRNKDMKPGDRPNGLFSTHPDTQARIDKVTRQIKTEKLNATAMGEARYASNVRVEAKPISAIVLADADTKGLTGSQSAAKTPAKEEPKKEEKKGGGMFGGLRNKLSGSPQQESTQASASAGARGVRPDRYAKGGDNPNKLTVRVAAGELDAFRKGIA